MQTILPFHRLQGLAGKCVQTMANASRLSGGYTIDSALNPITRTLGAVLLLLGMNIGSVNAQITYYSKSVATDFNDLTSWGTNTDGTGTNPLSISNADNFVIQNSSVISLTANANVRQLTINGGSLTIAGNTLTIAITGQKNSSLLLNSGSTLNVSGGILSLGGNLLLSAGGKLNQSGGDIIVDGNNGSAAATSVASGVSIVDFSPAGLNDVTLTAGTLTIVDPHASLTASEAFKFNTVAVGTTAASPSHTFQFGDGVSSDAGGNVIGFKLLPRAANGGFKFGNLVVNGPTGTNRIVTFGTTFIPMLVGGNVTVNNGGDLRHTGTSATSGMAAVNGNFTVNAGGTFTSLGTLILGNVVYETASSFTQSASTNAQVIGGDGVFRNSVTSPTANFTNLIINNSNNTGVTFSSAASLLSASNTGTVSGTFTLTNGLVNTAGNKFILGTSGTTLGALTYTSGGFTSGSTFGRWVGTAGTGTVIAASTIPAFGAGSFPFVTGNSTTGFIANHFHKGTAALTTAGVFSVTYNGTTGLSPLISPVSENALIFDNATNASWTVSTSPAYVSSTDHSFAIQALNAYTAFSANARLLIGGALAGTHQAGTVQPMVERIGVPPAGINGVYRIGMISSELPNNSVASGAWDNAASWSLGIPVCGQNILINSADSIWINGTTTVANAGGVIVSGKLGVSGSTLNVGCINNNNLFAVNGKLYVSGGRLNINGNLNVAGGSLFWQTGGNITIDGNAGGVLANSIADGIPIVNIETGSIKLSGGIFTITDPHAGVTGINANRAFYYTGATAIDTTFGWTLKFGDGISADAGGAIATPVGFVVDMAGGKIVIDSLVIHAGITGTNRFVTLNNSTTLGCNRMYITTDGEARISSQTVIAGNLTNNGRLINTAGAVTFGTFIKGTVGTSPFAQVVGGTGGFRNAVTAAGSTASFTNITINNNHPAGVTFLADSALLSGLNTGTVSGIFTLSNGIVNTGAKAFILGTGTSVTGTLTYTAGGLGAGSTFGRWWATTTDIGQSITAGGVPSPGVGTYPFVNLGATVPFILNNRFVYVRQTTASTTGGLIKIKYNELAGLSPASITDGTYIVDNRSNANWQVSAAGITGSPTYTVAIGGAGIYPGTNVNSRITLAAGAISGTHQAGTTLPIAQRAGLTFADMNNTWYIGANASDVSFKSVASGNWENGAIWNKGVAPGCADSVVIDNGHAVTIGGAIANARAIVISTTGILNITGNTTTVGCTMNNASIRIDGKLSVSGGTLTLNGSLLNNTSGRFHHSGGTIIVDGNDSGKAATSASDHQINIYATTDTSLVFTGGTIRIVDPTVNASSSAFKILPSQPVNFGTGHTLQFGDGVSTQPGGTLGFNINLFNTGTGLASLGNVIVNTPWGTNRFVNTSNTIGILGNLTVTAGNYRMTSAHTVKGNIVNNDTLVNASILTLADPSNAVTSTNTVAQSITGTGKFLNAVTGATAGTTSLTVRNSSAGGVTIGAKLSVSAAFTLTRGIVNTNATDTFRLGTATAAATLSGGSDTAYVNGPISRTYPASHTAAGSYTDAARYPVGKNGRYLPFWIDPATTSGGPVVISGEAFTTNTGSLGAGAISISPVRWESFVGAGSANFTGSNLGLSDTAVAAAATTQIMSSTSAAGAYTGVAPAIVYASGPPRTIMTSGSLIAAADYKGHFAYGQVVSCSAPVAQPTSFITANIGGTAFDASFTGAIGNPDRYLVVRYATGQPEVTPTNNTTYNINAALGTGTVVANTATTSFSQTGLTAATTYDYYIYAYNNHGCLGPVYNTAFALFSSVTTCPTVVTTPTSSFAAAITNSSFTARWSKNANPAVTYILDVSTNSIFNSFLPGYQNFLTGTDTFAVITGLAVSTSYYYRVRAIDGSCVSLLSSTMTTVTSCNPITSLPYIENFNTNIAIPTCASVFNGNDANTWTVQGAPTDYTGNVLRYIGNGTALAGNDWFFTAPITLVGGVTYSLKYSYGNNSAFYTEAMRVKFGDNPGPDAMTTMIADYPAITGGVRNSASVNLTPALSGIYYIGFQTYSVANQFYLYLDDIVLSATVPPAVISSSATNITQVSAKIGGNVTSAGDGIITASGVVIGTTASPSIGDLWAIDSVRTPAVQSGSYSFNLAGLTSATTYHYRAYAINSAGTTYGGDSTFVTLAAPTLPIVTKLPAANINGYAATLNGNVMSDGGIPVSASGIVYSTTSNPVIGGLGVVNSLTSPVVLSGTFSINPAGLMPNTKYYFKAYATNGLGTAYSDQDSFTTEFVITTLPYAQNFETGAGSWKAVTIGTGINNVNNWVLGTPAKTILNGAHSGSNAWVTKVTGTYDIYHDAAVVSPQMDFTSVTNPVLRFYHKFVTESNVDAMIVEISTNGGGSWTKLDNTAGNPTNFNTPNSYAWYNNNATNGPVPPPKFTSTTTGVPPTDYASNVNGWIESATPLTGAAGQPNVLVRFHFMADLYQVYEGWAIDDIEIVDVTTPATPASAVNLTNIGSENTTVSWTNGNGQGRLVVARLTSIPPIAPTNNILYTPNSAFGMPKTGFGVVGITGSGNYIVYKDNATSTVVTGLSMLTDYTYDVYEYSGKYMHVKFAAAASNNGTTLPVRLSSFAGLAKGNDVVLTWTTASEINNLGFEVERSVDGRSFEKAGFVKGAGNSNRELSYSLADCHAFARTGVNALYYRLKQLDADGRFIYSNIIVVNIHAENVNGLSVFPNPFTARYTLSFSAKAEAIATIEMMDIQGKLVNTQLSDIAKGYNAIVIDNLSELHTGIYFVKVTIEDETHVMKLVKNQP